MVDKNQKIGNVYIGRNRHYNEINRVLVTLPKGTDISKCVIYNNGVYPKKYIEQIGIERNQYMNLNELRECSYDNTSCVYESAIVLLYYNIHLTKAIEKITNNGGDK